MNWGNSSMSKRSAVEVIPSPSRLIHSLRDIGYEFEEAVADIIDNAIEARATVIKVDLRFEGEDSYLTIMDNGIGMTSGGLQEALRFGTKRDYYSEGDLGRFGLGLKTASLSQCEKFTVSSRKSQQRALVSSYCWDLPHISETNSWEILEVEPLELKPEVFAHLKTTTGTVVTWERLGRLLEYRYPAGVRAMRQAQQLTESLKLHLGMVFHRFLAGEVIWKRLAIYVNDEMVEPWDPFARAEPKTQVLKPIRVPLDLQGFACEVDLRPYVLPPLVDFSSPAAHRRAGGPGRWNKQQGFYIYRANRIIQAGGWGGIRTSDEHTKLVRIGLFIPPGADEYFRVDIAKKHAVFPRLLREALVETISPTLQAGQNRYRESELGEIDQQRELLEKRIGKEIKRLEEGGVLREGVLDSLIKRFATRELDVLRKLLGKIA